MMFRTVFVVVGIHPFPIDMLRFDGCFPRDEISSNDITSSITQRNGSEKIIRLVKVHSNRLWTPTEGRWNSFDWRVVSESIRTERT
jgi:hypothetical protein